MIIKIDNYLIDPQNVGFDLIEEVEYRKIGEGTKDNPTGEMATRGNIIVYNGSLEYCINRLIHLKLKKNESVVDLKSFILEYKKEREIINNLIYPSNNVNQPRKDKNGI